MTTGGEPADRGTSASAGEIEGEVLRRSNMAPDVPDTVRPRRKVGRRAPVQSHVTESQEQAHLSRPSDDEGTHDLAYYVLSDFPDVPLSNFVSEAKSGRSQPAQR